MQENGNGVEDYARRPEEDLPPEEALSALADPHARHALRALHGRRDSTLEELADVVTGMVAAASDEVATPTDRDRTRLRLYHAVLPRLDALGYVEFDADERTVTRVDVPPEALAVLDGGE